MTEFFLSLLIFFLAHLIPPMPPVRLRLIKVFGRRVYMLGFSTLSLALLTWVISASWRAPFIMLWPPAPWQAVVPIVAMPMAFWLILAGLAEINPLSISLRQREGSSSLPPIVSITRHPVPWGFIFWAGAHIAPNGDVVSLVLFGALTALGILGLRILDRRARLRLGEEKWNELAQSTSIIPFAAILAGRSRFGINSAFVIHTCVAIAAYFWFLFQGHRILIGTSPLAWIIW